MATSPTDTLYFGNVDSQITERLLYEICIQAGPVQKVTVVPGKSFAFCAYPTVEDAIYAQALLQDNLYLFGRKVTVSFGKSGKAGNQD